MSKPTSRRSFLAIGALAALCAGTNAARAAGGKLAFDLAPYEKIPAVKFPWGWIRWVMNAELDPKAELTVGLVYIEPNQTNTLHLHPNSDEVIHILAGACDHRLGQRHDQLKTGDTLRIPVNVPHNARTVASPCLAMIIYNTGKRQMVPVAEGKPV
jgi:quercetin dioxygenase-like cupin family protein